MSDGEGEVGSAAALAWPHLTPTLSAPEGGEGEFLEGTKGSRYATRSYGNRCTFSMFLPSMRISRVVPARRGECRSPSL